MNNFSDDRYIKKHSVLDKRRAGVLLPITSLPEASLALKLNAALNFNENCNNACYQTINKNNGDFSQAFFFIDFLQSIGCSVWQILPLGPTHADKSPYQCLSAHAGNPLLISIDWLRQREYLPQLAIEDCILLTQHDKKNIYIKRSILF